jgi:hypothetical protein
MADLYGSHPFVMDVVKDLPRDDYVLLSKIWPRKADWVDPSGGAKEEIDRFRKELKVDQIEICLIHCMQNGDWPTEFERIRDELSELKDKKVIRATGVSCHNLDALKVASTSEWGGRDLCPHQPQGRRKILLRRNGRRGQQRIEDSPPKRQSGRGHEDLWCRQTGHERREERVTEVRLH